MVSLNSDKLAADSYAEKYHEQIEQIKTQKSHKVFLAHQGIVNDLLRNYTQTVVLPSIVGLAAQRTAKAAAAVTDDNIGVRRGVANADRMHTDYVNPMPRPVVAAAAALPPT